MFTRAFIQTLQKITDNLSGLTYLRLQIPNLQIHRLAQALEANTKITTLELTNDEYFDVQILECLAAMLMLNTGIKELTLEFENQMPESASILTNAIKENYSLQKVNFLTEFEGDESAKCFAELLLKNTMLSSLTFCIIDITDQGLDILLDALEKNTHIMDFWFTTNRVVKEDFFVKISHILNRNRRIKNAELIIQNVGFYKEIQQTRNSFFGLLPGDVIQHVAILDTNSRAHSQGRALEIAGKAYTVISDALEQTNKQISPIPRANL